MTQRLYLIGFRVVEQPLGRSRPILGQGFDAGWLDFGEGVLAGGITVDEGLAGGAVADTSDGAGCSSGLGFAFPGSAAGVDGV